MANTSTHNTEEEGSYHVTLTDLSQVQGSSMRAILVPNPIDIVEGCDIEGHIHPDVTPYDQIMSAIASVMGEAPKRMFRVVMRGCTCKEAMKPVQAQAIAYMGMAGMLSIAKEITDRNRSYIAKR